MRRVVCVVTLAIVAAGCQPGAARRIENARNLIFEKKPDAALKQYRLALDALEHDDSPAAGVLRARALKGAADTYYLELHDFSHAAEVYQELIHSCPEAPESLDGRIRLANLLHDHFNDLRGAINALTAAIDRGAPQSAELEYRVAKLYFELGDYQQATVECDKVARRFENSPFVDDALLLKGQAFSMMKNRNADAMRAYQHLVEKFPDSSLAPFALYELGRIKAEAGEREAAIELWVRALKHHPEPQMVQDSIARIRRQIIERTPTGVGRPRYAFDHVKQPPARTSLEAAGGTAEQAAHERGGD